MCNIYKQYHIYCLWLHLYIWKYKYLQENDKHQVQKGGYLQREEHFPNLGAIYMSVHFNYSSTILFWMSRMLHNLRARRKKVSLYMPPCVLERKRKGDVTQLLACSSGRRLKEPVRGCPGKGLGDSSGRETYLLLYPLLHWLNLFTVHSYSLLSTAHCYFWMQKPGEGTWTDSPKVPHRQWQHAWNRSIWLSGTSPDLLVCSDSVWSSIKQVWLPRVQTPILNTVVSFGKWDRIMNGEVLRLLYAAKALILDLEGCFWWARSVPW